MTPSGKSFKTKPQKPSRKAKALAARLMAVQATYQMMKNKKPMDIMVDEYLSHRTGMEVEGETLIQPDGILFKNIMYGVEERIIDLESVLQHNLSNKNRGMEPLIQSMLLCASWELLAHQEIEPAIIINDYLNVAHSFFDAGEIGLLNGILDAVAKAFRS